MLIQIHQILAAVSVLVALLMIVGCFQYMHRMKALLELYRKDAAYENSVSIAWARRYKRERALTDALSALLFSLVHTSTKESLRWKFMILREIEPLLRSGAYVNDESVYQRIRARLIDADKYSREKLFDEITDQIKEYYTIDLGDAEPLIDIFRKVLVTGDRVDEAKGIEESLRQDLATDYTELLKTFGPGAEMVDLDPFGDPIDRGSKTREGPPETKEEAFDRLIRMAKEMDEFIIERWGEPKPESEETEEPTKETIEEKEDTDEPGDRAEVVAEETS